VRVQIGEESDVGQNNVITKTAFYIGRNQSRSQRLLAAAVHALTASGRNAYCERTMRLVFPENVTREIEIQCGNFWLTLQSSILKTCVCIDSDERRGSVFMDLQTPSLYLRRKLSTRLRTCCLPAETCDESCHHARVASMNWTTLDHVPWARCV
jgi:hypothetical protein